MNRYARLNLETLPIVFPDTDTYIRLFEQHILDEIRTQSLQQREKYFLREDENR